MRDPCAETDRVRKTERRVVAKAEVREPCDIPVRVAAQVVVAVSAHLARERLERSLFFRQQRYVVRCRVAAVQAYLGSRVEQRLDETWPELFVGLRRGAVVRVMVPCQHEKGRAACPPPALLGHDLREAPV